ncbi:hypothetical protein SAMN04489712_105181 [Thermomonospora echinospora]|uniref:Uncharacterized protein n=1 Tax=Thermomonospora echinospora TaxID=1992 RepID=A0A1H6A348_9ACTN|nr:hypothetical protein [Thermomonospora echinospora]SEG43149.1 hypothetical protein SAMN04489712_105181 [Thermomonospora echinospora]
MRRPRLTARPAKGRPPGPRKIPAPPALRRGRLAGGLGALALSAGLLAAPATAAHAESAYQPGPADFDDCPQLPPGVLPALWHCLAITVVGGRMTLGSLEQELTQPVQITVAMGPKDRKLTLLEGGIKSDPIPVNPLPLPVDLLGMTVEVRQAGPIVPAPILPASIPLKIKVNQLLVGGNCYIGSDAEPIAVKPNLGELALGSIGGVPVITTRITDDTFAVPAVTTCGLLGNPAINLIAGLPSAAGKNSATMDVAIRVKNYRLGVITGPYARDNAIG